MYTVTFEFMPGDQSLSGPTSAADNINHTPNSGHHQLWLAFNMLCFIPHTHTCHTCMSSMTNYGVPGPHELHFTTHLLTGN